MARRVARVIGALTLVAPLLLLTAGPADAAASAVTAAAPPSAPSPGPIDGPDPTDTTASPPVDAAAAVTEAVSDHPTTVVVGLDPAAGAAELRKAGATGRQRTDAVDRASAIYRDAKAAALRTVPAQVAAGLHIVEDYDALPVQIIRVDTAAALTALANAPGVDSVTLPATYQPVIDQDLVVIHQPEAEQSGYTGAGTVIAVIDSGVDYLRAGANGVFGDCGAGPGQRTCRIDHLVDVSGSGQRDSDPGGHGTNVAGVVAKTAPDAHLDVYGVFDATGTAATDADVLSALNAITRDGPARGVRAVNMSLGSFGTRFTSECTGSVYSGVFSNLRSVGIIPVVAAGNAAYGGGSFAPGVAVPACATGALRVGATYPVNQFGTFIWGPSGETCTDRNPAQDDIACFSQTGRLLSLLAPGIGIVGAGVTQSGTSQATPHVAGAIADLVDANPAATVQQLEYALVSTGPAITDPRDGTTVNRLDIAAAAAAVRGSLPVDGCTASSLGPTDDGSSAETALPFPAHFYSGTYQTLFVNNNGSVTFTAPMFGVPALTVAADTPPIIAPFLADVDTTGAASGLVTYGPTTYGSRPAFCVRWNRVGYYNARTDKLNTFALLLVDRSDIAAGDFDILMTYDSINWETGRAQGGSNGIGGTAASVGFSAADGDPAHFFRFPGSQVSLALLNPNMSTGLVNNGRGSLQLGRYIFAVRNGQPPGSGAITGFARDGGGAALANAPVEACPASGGSCVVTVTGSDGHYRTLGLGDGDWTLTMNPPAGSVLAPTQSAPVTVTAGATVTVDVTAASPIPLPANASITNHGLHDGVPLLFWTDEPDLGVSNRCPGGTAQFQLTQGPTTRRTGALSNVPAGSGSYSGRTDLYPLHGHATVRITVACPGGSSETATFSVYLENASIGIRDGTAAPVGGAAVTLLRADTAAGPFVPVPDGGAIMSPSNRTNPDLSAADGVVHRDLLAGFYQYTATKRGCVMPGTDDPVARSAVFEARSPVLVTPPPSLSVVMDCTRPTAPGAFTSVSPSRILDTRSNLGAPGPIPALGTITLQVTGIGVVPAADVAAVALNITAVGPSSAGYLTVWPAGTTLPTVSNLNFQAGQNIPNMVIVPVGATGQISVFNGSAGVVHLVGDVAGYVLDGTPVDPGAFTSLAPARIMDTRSNLGANGPAGALGTVTLQVTGTGGIPGGGVSAVALNVTAVAPTQSGYLTVWPAGSGRPTASNLNFQAGQNIPNLVIVPVGSNGRISLFNGSAGTVHLLADVAGYYVAGAPAVPGAFVALAPSRIMDTRTLGNPAPALGTVTLQVTGTGGIPANGVAAAVLNVTAVAPGGAGYLTVWPAGTTRLTASSLNFRAGQNIPNLVIVPVGANGQISVFNGSAGTVHLLADVAGYIRR